MRFKKKRRKNLLIFAEAGLNLQVLGIKEQLDQPDLPTLRFLRELERCVDPIVAGVVPAQRVLTCDPECVPTSLLSGARAALITSHSGLGSETEISSPDTKKPINPRLSLTDEFNTGIQS